MSIRRRSIKARVGNERMWEEKWEEHSNSLRVISEHITTCIADRDAHRRLDDEGSPPLSEPYDPYFDLVEATTILTERANR